MKKFNRYLACLAVFALFFTSCSKDEPAQDTSEKATLSFGAIVQDLAAKSATKQAEVGDLPTCSDDTPAYVEIALMQDGNAIVGTLEDPFRVDLVADQLFTEEVPELELEPGTYSLEHFSVYNEAGELIWLAPKGGTLADWVDNPLPLSINLGAGVKKYVDVSVLCYDDRDVNEYGYQFFELQPTKAFEFCFFANYCTPEGRHYPARYSVDISIDGEPVYTEVINTTGMNDNDEPYAEPLCFALPDLSDYEDDEEYIDYTITLLDWEGVYDAAEMAPITGSLSRNEVMANFDGDDNVDYMHVRFGCGDVTPPDNDQDDDGIDDDVDNCPDVYNPDQADADGDGVGDACDNCVNTANPDQADSDDNGIGDACETVDECADKGGDSDEDGICDDDDNCPNVYNPTQMDTDNDGIGNACDDTPGGDTGGDTGDDLDECETAIMYGDTSFYDLDLQSNRWGWAEHFGVGEDGNVEEGVFQLWAAAGQNDFSKGYYIGNVHVEQDGDDVTVWIDMFDGNELNEVHIYISDAVPTTTAPGQYGHTYYPESEDELSWNFTNDGEFWLIVHADACPSGE